MPVTLVPASDMLVHQHRIAVRVRDNEAGGSGRLIENAPSCV